MWPGTGRVAVRLRGDESVEARSSGHRTSCLLPVLLREGWSHTESSGSQSSAVHTASPRQSQGPWHVLATRLLALPGPWAGALDSDLGVRPAFSHNVTLGFGHLPDGKRGVDGTPATLAVMRV